MAETVSQQSSKRFDTTKRPKLQMLACQRQSMQISKISLGANPISYQTIPHHIISYHDNQSHSRFCSQSKGINHANASPTFIHDFASSSNPTVHLYRVDFISGNQDQVPLVALSNAQISLIPLFSPSQSPLPFQSLHLLSFLPSPHHKRNTPPLTLLSPSSPRTPSRTKRKNRKLTSYTSSHSTPYHKPSPYSPSSRHRPYISDT